MKLRSNRLPVDVFSVALFAPQRAAPELALVIDSDETGRGSGAMLMRVGICVSSFVSPRRKISGPRQTGIWQTSERWSERRTIRQTTRR